MKEIKELSKLINEAEAIVIGAGAGLSTAAGFVYDGLRFEKYFSDIKEKYGFSNMYEGGFYPFESLEEFWGYWSRYIFINRYDQMPSSLYEDLLDSVKDKDYFVLTTNVDHCFQRAGFDKERLFYTQGDYGLFQCSGPCSKETYDNKEIILQMLKEQKDGKIPSELIPYCPKCGRPMTTNLRADDKFVQDKGWYQAQENYINFLKKFDGKKVLFLELGVGYNTPGIIKYNFWQMTKDNPNARYVNINTDELYLPKEIVSQSLLIKDDLKKTLKKLKEELDN